MIRVADANGNPESGVTVAFTAPSSGARARCSATGNVTISGTTNSSGQLSEAITANSQAGSYSVTASTSGVSTPAAFSLTNTATTLGIFTAGVDIGTPGRTGSASYNAATQTYTVPGGGTDIWNTSDKFHYLYTTVHGDATIIAQVASMTTRTPSAKSGVMFRNGTAASAAFALVAVTPSNGVVFEWRTRRRHRRRTSAATISPRRSG